MPIKKVPAATFSSGPSADKREAALKLLADPTNRKRLRERAKTDFDKAFGLDSEAKTEVEDFGRKAP